VDIISGDWYIAESVFLEMWKAGEKAHSCVGSCRGRQSIGGKIQKMLSFD